MKIYFFGRLWAFLGPFHSPWNTPLSLTHSITRAWVRRWLKPTVCYLGSTVVVECLCCCPSWPGCVVMMDLSQSHQLWERRLQSAQPPLSPSVTTDNKITLLLPPPSSLHQHTVHTIFFTSELDIYYYNEENFTKSEVCYTHWII